MNIVGDPCPKALLLLLLNMSLMEFNKNVNCMAELQR